MLELSQIKTKSDFEANFQSEIWLDTAKEICRRHRITFNEIKRTGGSEHIVFLIDSLIVLKIYKPFRNCFERETKALEFIAGKTDFKIPEIIYTGEFKNFQYCLMTQLSDDSITRNDWLKISEKSQMKFVSKLTIGLKQIHELDAGSFQCDWAEYVKDRAQTFIKRQIAHGVNSKVLSALPGYIEENLKLVPTGSKMVFMHADVHFGNLRVINVGGNLHPAGLFDFADSRCGFYEYEFTAVGVLMIQGQGSLQREFFKSYGYAEKDLDETMRRRLMMLTMLYETADLRRYAMRLRPEALSFSLPELEKGIWSFAN